MTSSQSPPSVASWFQRTYQTWDRFWFTPADPTLLGLIRIGCGIIALYTTLAYCFDLQAFMGEHAWLDRTSRLQTVREKPTPVTPLSGNWSPLPPPANERERGYYLAYKAEFGADPPAPYPRDDDEMNYCHRFRRNFGFDLRMYGLSPPGGDDPEHQEWQTDFLEKFAAAFRQPPAPPYPTTEKEAQEIINYMARYGEDPHRLLAKGMPIFSLWFDVTDPLEMNLIHSVFIGVTFLFLIGCCTRLTSVLTWFASLNYIHRAPEVLFGADTMMNILLIYLMIGPSGAALSVDRLLARWWSRNKPSVVNRWRALLGKPPLPADQLLTTPIPAQPVPSIGANLAVRLLQVHLCIIYFVAGIAKLQGQSWWSGQAVYGTIANFEFAPMQFELYNSVLFWMCRHEFLLNLFLFTGTYFTLAFEIGYAFLIWRPSFRRFILASAFLLHGLIGTLMGLKTFALIMLVMNMAFLSESEAKWIVKWSRRLLGLKGHVHEVGHVG